MIRLALSLAVLLSASLPARAAVDIVEVTSPGGLTAWLVEEHSIPFTALEIRFRGGASLEADGKRGAINLMTGLLEEGAADMDAQAFARSNLRRPRCWHSMRWASVEACSRPLHPSATAR